MTSQIYLDSQWSLALCLLQGFVLCLCLFVLCEAHESHRLSTSLVGALFSVVWACWSESATKALWMLSLKRGPKEDESFINGWQIASRAPTFFDSRAARYRSLLLGLPVRPVPSHAQSHVSSFDHKNKAKTLWGIAEQIARENKCAASYNQSLHLWLLLSSVEIWSWTL